MARSPWPVAIAWSVLVNRRGLARSLAALPAAFLFSAVLGLVLERTLYVHVYRKTTSGSGAVHDRPGLHVGGGGGLRDGLGPGSSSACRTWLEGQFNLFGVGLGRYRLLIIVICGLLTIGAAAHSVAHALRQPAARLGRRCAGGARARHQRQRACSRSPSRSARALPGLGGALGAEILGLDPTFPLKYMIYFLIVVTVGGTSSITGPFLRLAAARHRRRGRQVLRAARSAHSSSTPS